MKQVILISTVLLAFSSCSYYVYPPKVDTRIEKEYYYKIKKGYEISKWQKSGQKNGYTRYDEQRNIIEEGEYGEIWRFRKVTRDSNGTISGMVSGHGYDFKKLNKVYYYTYDSTGRKIQDQLWKFQDNKKDFLVYKTTFEYDSDGNLTKEIEFDENGSISRLQDYSKNDDYKISEDSVFETSFKGIIRVKGMSRDTIILDSLGRPIEKIHYYKNRFLSRTVFRYDRWDSLVTEIKYNDKPDSLWCIIEWKYNSNKQPVRKFWKVIGCTTETKDIYIYNRKKLLVKILHYSGDKLEGYTKYRYKLH